MTKSRYPREQKKYRMFDGKRFEWADWAPTKSDALRSRARHVKALPWVNIRVVKMKHGYNIYIRY